MPSVFTRIFAGELPGRIVWEDDSSVALLSITPLRPGHTLVVPRREVDHWLDLDAPTFAHLWDVSRTIGQALMRVFRPTKVGVLVAGLEVRHLHIHLVPIDQLNDLDFARQDKSPDPAALDDAAERIRTALTP